jgi:hypothetical protein
LRVSIRSMGSFSPYVANPFFENLIVYNRKWHHF